MVVRHHRAGGGQAINVRCVRFASVSAEIHEGGVVNQNENDVRPPRGGRCFLLR
jgi:hypothetical protein